MVGLPWFMYDINNKQLITSATIPEGEIKDAKSVFITETPIPGKNFQPITQAGNGNRKVSFTLPVVQRNGLMGNMLLMRQFDLLRNQSQGFLGGGTKRGQFTPNPKVLYYWGVGTVPLVYYVTKCDFRHTANMVGQLGQPRTSYVDLELTLDETDPLYKIEESFRNVSAVIGMFAGAGLTALDASKIRTPF